ncbi:hypothetical protein [Psychromicrobium lacuslunae]|uniref:Ribosomal protein L7/L12 C-terminal domain-containing protein n=1 Tax=Psychromicrobium lacuslunae TaxID=1618207 RepID=A0A0D4C0S9_9MICC|nr:hypothetical protein [Psychromicrobium lacuslunae]AJT42287.1 hypothetical protein UM93_13725 [Psychromicrobium lacuslunae]
MEWFFVVLIAIVGLIVLIWALRVGRNKGQGVSEADRYLQQLTARSHSAQVSRPQSAPPGQGQQGQPAQGYPVQGYAAAGRPTQQPMQLPPQLVMQAQALVRGGRKIEAVKLIRQVTGLDLASAKRIADSL